MVYTIGFGVPALLYLILKFLKCRTLSLPDVPMANIAYLPVWVFVWMFRVSVCAVHNSSGMAAVAADGVRHGQFNSFSSAQPDVVPLRP